MSVYTPQLAPVVLLAFLGTMALLTLCLLAMWTGALRKSRPMVLGGMAVGLILLLGYGSILLGLSLLSRDVALTPGAWKYFCELDCHMAYSIGGVQVAPAAGPKIETVTASGRFAIVQLKTWFDPSTISPGRGNRPLTPNARTITLVDNRGRKFLPSAKSELVLAAARLHSTPLGEALRPGESYVSYVVFEIPSEAQGLKLLLTSADPEDCLIWGHESSPLHAKAYFTLQGT
jgi:hypothetical protein